MHGLPVNTVHILQIETVTIGTPCLVKDLVPLLVVVDGGNHVVKVDSLAQVGLAG